MLLCLASLAAAGSVQSYTASAYSSSAVQSLQLLNNRRGSTIQMGGGEMGGGEVGNDTNYEVGACESG